MNSDYEDDPDKPSKSQRKRDMDALKTLADRLTALSTDQLSAIDEPEVRAAVDTAKKITKGNARKRQIQYIAKLLSRVDVSPIQAIIDKMDASSDTYIQKFHQLESWRERLIEGDTDVMSEIFSTYPDCERQKIRHLTRSAITERQQGQQQVHYRRLFQFLKKLDTTGD